MRSGGPCLERVAAATQSAYVPVDFFARPWLTPARRLAVHFSTLSIALAALASEPSIKCP